ncbi:MAG: hypothetical protein ABL921_28725 [Pirellula sp.]
MTNAIQMSDARPNGSPPNHPDRNWIYWIIGCAGIVVLLVVVNNLFPSKSFFGEPSDRLEELGQRAEQLMSDGKPELAIRELDNFIERSRDKARLYVVRGALNFRRGEFDQSIADFDKTIELQPQSEPFLWQRGISLYYAKKYQQGLDQFATHFDVNPNDVENTFWHFLCNAGVNGLETARKELRPAANDPRPPMMQIQAMLQGDLKPEQVIEAARQSGLSAEANKMTEFHGLLYVGLYCDAANLHDQARAYLTQCIELGLQGYMTDVAKLHLSKLSLP